jgi:phasin family protein
MRRGGPSSRPVKPRPAASGLQGETSMVKNFEDMQKLGKDNMDAMQTSLGVWSKGFQTIAVEMADYSRKAFEDGTAAAEKLFGAKSIDKAVEVQSDYLKTAYEQFVAQATKVGELYAGMAQEIYKPFENTMSKTVTK